ncbi:hypothetical protein OSB04_028630 [Centaurea solstitialis]|uniref:Uncharacterized protein n=1 Tax=Centaurea solstitialis TaxID=347529 RepID=A0AA38SHM6_9ASTR|nr:hypothetical protein OSB04_028630 [Centaurea solstitialis]
MQSKSGIKGLPKSATGVVRFRSSAGGGAVQVVGDRSRWWRWWFAFGRRREKQPEKAAGERSSRRKQPAVVDDAQASEKAAGGGGLAQASRRSSRDGRLDAVIERLESTRVKIPLRTSWDSEFAYLSQEEYDLALQAQEEHNMKQKESFLSAQAARRLASDFVDEDDEISADPVLAQKAVLKVFNRNAEEQAEEVNSELDWCRDRLHLRKHGAAILGIHLSRTRGKKAKTWITVKRSGVKDVQHTLDKLDRYNLSEWNEIRSLLPKANKNYRAEVEEVINGLIARIRRTTEVPDDLLQPSSALPQPPVRRSAGTSTRRPTPCMPRTIIKPLDLSMLDLSFPSGVSLSEGQVIREPVHGICVSDNSKNLRFQRFSELHKAPYEHLVSVLFIAQKDKKNKDNKEIIRTVRAILDQRIAFGETPIPIQVKTEDQDQEMNESVLQSTDPDHRSEDLLKTSRSYSKNHQRLLGAKSDCIRDHKIVLKLKSKAKSKLLKESQSFIVLKFGRNLPVSVNYRSYSSSVKMYRDLLSMGSKSKPPVLQIGEYPQWRVRMIQFLNNIDKTLMTSIQEGPIKPFIDIPGTPETATTPAIEPRRVYKLFRHYNELEKIRAEIDDKALTFLTMAIPNDLFNRVDSRKTAKELWDELQKQFQGTERSIQAKLNQAIGAYEGFTLVQICFFATVLKFMLVTFRSRTVTKSHK